MADQNMTPAPEATPPTGVDPTATPASAPVDAPPPAVAQDATQPESPMPTKTDGFQMAKESWLRQLYDRTPDQGVPIPTVADTSTGPTSASEKLLFGPTMRPEEPITTGVNMARPTHPPIPAEVMGNLDVLRMVAMRKDAPPEVLNLLMAIAREGGGG